MNKNKGEKLPYDIFPILFQAIAEFTNESSNLTECSSGTSTLAIAAQVSRDWKDLALLHLYRHVTVNLASTQKLLTVLKKNPQLALRVESLSVIDPLLNIDGRWEYFPVIQRLASLCSNLKSLETVDVKTSKFVKSETLEALHLKLHKQVYFFQIQIPSSIKVLSIHDRDSHLRHTTEIDEAFERLSVTTRLFPGLTSPGNLAVTTLILATNSYNAIKLVPWVSETLKNLDIYLSNNLNPDVLMKSLLPTVNKLERLRVQFTPTKNQIHISSNNIQTTTTSYHHIFDLLFRFTTLKVLSITVNEGNIDRSLNYPHQLQLLELLKDGESDLRYNHSRVRRIGVGWENNNEEELFALTKSGIVVKAKGNAWSLSELFSVSV